MRQDPEFGYVGLRSDGFRATATLSKAIVSGHPINRFARFSARPRGSLPVFTSCLDTRKGDVIRETQKGHLDGEARVLAQRAHSLGIDPPAIDRRLVVWPAHRRDRGDDASGTADAREFLHPDPRSPHMLDHVPGQHNVEGSIRSGDFILRLHRVRESGGATRAPQSITVRVDLRSEIGRRPCHRSGHLPPVG